MKGTFVLFQYIELDGHFYNFERIMEVVHGTIIKIYGVRLRSPTSQAGRHSSGADKVCAGFDAISRTRTKDPSPTRVQSTPKEEGGGDRFILAPSLVRRNTNKRFILLKQTIYSM